MAPSIVKRYAIAFQKYKVAGFAVCALSIGASSVVGLKEAPPPSYVAKAELTYNQRPAPYFANASEQIGEMGKQIVTREFFLDDNIFEVAAQETNTPMEQIKFSAKVTPPPEEGPPIFTLYYQGMTEEQTKNVADLLVEGAIEKSRFVNQARLDAIIESINEQLPDIEREMREAERALEAYERVEGAAIISAVNGTLVGRITESQQLQQHLESQIQAINAQMQSLERQLGLSPDGAYVALALSADPLIANLRSQIYQVESQISIQSQLYRPSHPQMVQLRQQLQSYEALLRDRAREVLGGGGVTAPLTGDGRIRQDSSLDPARQQLASQLVALATEREKMQEQLRMATENERELTAEFESLPNKQLERERLAKQLAYVTDLYDRMQAALVDAEAAKAETVTSLTVATPPSVQEKREDPPPMILVLIVGAGAGLVGGAIVIFLLAALEGRLYTAEEAQNALQERDIPVLGTIPEIAVFDEFGGDRLPAIVAVDSPYLEFYERLRSNLRRLGEKPPKVVLLTSAGAEEGKTLSAYNLAITSARAGKRTLLIEADVRSPSEAEALKVAIDPESQSEPLRHYGSTYDSLRLVPDVENLFVLTSPGPQRRAAAIVESSEMKRCIEEARARFDFVVIDAPSLSRCNDALLLEPLSDGLLLVTRPRYTQGSLLAENAEMLEEAEDIRVLGAIVNGADIPVELPLFEEEILEEEDTIDTTDTEFVAPAEEVSESEAELLKAKR